MSMQQQKVFLGINKTSYRIILRHTAEYMSKDDAFSKRYIIAQDIDLSQIQQDWKILDEKLIPILKEISAKKRKPLVHTDLENFVKNPNNFSPPPLIETVKQAKKTTEVSESSVIFEGELVKEGSRVKNWKQRYFTLYFDRLEYRKKQEVRIMISH